jgi:hypothetical protein
MGFLLMGLVTTLLERELPNREKPELGYDLWYCLPFDRQDRAGKSLILINRVLENLM